MAADTKDVQAPPLMPWEHEPAVSQVDAMEQFAGELENELYGGEGEEPVKKKPAAEEVEVDESDEDEEIEAEDEVEDDETEDELEAEAEDDSEEAEWDFEEGEWDEVVRAQAHRPKVQGEEIEVTYDELLAGYSRTEDYTRKSQQREEERRAEKAANAQVREQLVEKLRAVEEALSEASPERSSEYWDRLRKESPERYAVEYADAQRVMAQKAALKREREQEEAALLEERNETFGEYARSEFTTLKQKMGWKDDNEARTGLQGLYDFAVTHFGFDERQLAGVVDHRLLVMLSHARNDIQNQAQGNERIRKKLKKTKTLKPGGRTVRKAPKKGRRLNQKAARNAARNLEETGSIAAAASFFEQMLSDED